MYAVVEIGGHQYRVAEGDLIYVDRQKEEAGDRFSIDQVLMLNDGEGAINIGGPVVEGASVKATLVDHVKADKVIVFRKKRRKGYKKKNGHRQPMSQIKIESISAPKRKKGETKKSKPKEGAKPKEAAKKAKSKETDKEKSASESKQKVSTDMSAKDAVEHIKNTPLSELKGFVPEDEDRVTVQREWDNKQEE